MTNVFGPALRCLALATLVFLTGCGASATPEKLGPPAVGGGAGEEEPFKESWTGSVTGVNPETFAGLPQLTPCKTEDDPTCAHHRLVIPARVKQVLVLIQQDQGSDVPDPAGSGAADNDHTLTVYNDKNQLVSYSESSAGTANESVVIQNEGSEYFDVRVSPFFVSPGKTFTATATEVHERAANDALDCLEAAPVEDLGISGITDDGQNVDLSVAVLLDGVDPSLAAEVMQRAADAYSPLNITLSVAGTEPMPLISSVSTEMIAETKVATGGVPPFGADLAVVFTNKTMQSTNGGASTVLGQADCIGGVRARTHSYLVATVEPEDAFELVPGLYLNVERGPETIAHEIGHLMGAHHHYGNCVEGVSPEDAVNGDVSPCDLMFPSVEPLSLKFATFPGAVVRGHAVKYASP